MDKIEERVAHLIRQCDELSEVVAAQARRIEVLERQVAFLVDRERRREESAGSVFLGDEPPPHY